MASASTGWFSAGSGPAVQVNCETELVRSTTTVTVYWTVRMKLPSSQSYLGTGSLEVSSSSSGGGSSGWQTIKDHNTRWSGTAEHSYSGSYTFSNSSTSTQTFTIYFSSQSDYFSSSGIFSTSVSCSVEGYNPYAYITSLSLKSRTINSLTFSYRADRTCSIYIKNDTDGTNWLNGGQPFVTNTTGGDITINYADRANTTRLTPNKSYTFTFLCRNSAGDTSKTGSGTTYQIATFSNVPDVNIGEEQTITWNNPSGANTSIKLYTTDGTEVLEDLGEMNTTSYTYTISSSTINKMYQLTPETDTYVAKYVITTTNNGQSYTSETNSNFKVVNSEPIFTVSNFIYVDNNPITTNLTSGSATSSIYISNYSNNHIEITTPAQLVNNPNGYIKAYKIVQGSKTAQYNLTGEETENITLDINNIDSSNFSVYAIDSREIPTKVDVTISNYLIYENLTIQNANIARKGNGVLSDTTLVFEGIFWKNSFGNIDNHITKDNGLTLMSVTYNYKLTTDVDYNSQNEKTILVTENNDGTYSFSGDIVGDEGAEGFTISNSYNIRLTVKDYLSTKTYYLTLGVGTPAIAIYKNSVAIGQKYDINLGGALQINGDIYQNGELLKSSDSVPIGIEVDYDGTTIPNGWEEITSGGLLLKAYTLYQNGNGATGDITLSESAFNFSYIEIFYGTNVHNSTVSSVKIAMSGNNAQICDLSCHSYSSNASILYEGSKRVNISGTTINATHSSYVTLTSGSTPTVSNGNVISIYKVVGYKEE